MTTHELAAVLLAGPNVKVLTAHSGPPVFEEITEVAAPFVVQPSVDVDTDYPVYITSPMQGPIITDGGLEHAVLL